jgi:hypothetical protein
LISRGRKTSLTHNFIRIKNDKHQGGVAPALYYSVVFFILLVPPAVFVIVGIELVGVVIERIPVGVVDTGCM